MDFMAKCIIGTILVILTIIMFPFMCTAVTGGCLYFGTRDLVGSPADHDSGPNWTPPPRKTRPRAMAPAVIPESTDVVTATPEPERVADTEPPVTPAVVVEPEPTGPTVYDICLAWGKKKTFVRRRIAQYERYRDKGNNEAETRKEAVRTCSFRSASPKDVLLCEACMEAVVDEVFFGKSVAVLDVKTAPKEDDDPFQACRKWGKGIRYVKEMSADYRVFKDAGLSKDEMLRGSLDACIERVTSSSQLPACRACMTEIIDELFKK